jgi:hypothetical protein
MHEGFNYIIFDLFKMLGKRIKIYPSSVDLPSNSSTESADIPDAKSGERKG